MKGFVITDLNLAGRVFRSGVLKYFSSEELKFYITDFCYSTRAATFINDKYCAEKMSAMEMLAIVGYSEDQMQRLGVILKEYKERFTFKTISALVLASERKFTLVAEDEVLREVASLNFNIKTYSKDELILYLFHELVGMGVQVDLDILKLVI